MIDLCYQISFPAEVNRQKEAPETFLKIKVLGVTFPKKLSSTYVILLNRHLKNTILKIRNCLPRDRAMNKVARLKNERKHQRTWN